MTTESRDLGAERSNPERSNYERLALPLLRRDGLAVSVAVLPSMGRRDPLRGWWRRRLDVTFAFPFLRKFPEGTFATELDPILIVNGNHLDGHRVTDLADIGDISDVFVGQFADVTESIFSGQDFNKGSEVFDTGDPAVVDLADLDGSRHGFHLLEAA